MNAWVHTTKKANSNNTGFITFDHNGVDAANMIFQDSNQTINTNASGQLVMNQVISHNHFTHLKADSISSIDSQTQNIRTIIHKAQDTEFKWFHHISNEDHKKNQIVTSQIHKSALETDSFIIFNISSKIKI